METLKENAHGGGGQQLGGIEDAKKDCPAFKNIPDEAEEKAQCPFTKVVSKPSGELARLAENCPAFQNDDGTECCPFKACDSVGKMKEVLASVPVSHRAAQGVPPSKQQVAMSTVLEGIHDVAGTEKAAVGAGCPHFEAKCPFKDTVPREAQEVELADAAKLKKITVFGIPASIEQPSSSEEDDEEKDNQEEQDVLAEVSASHDQEVSTPTLGLDKLLKLRTKDVHNEAHQVNFVKLFTRGKVGRDHYKQLLVRLYKVYLTMERCFDAACKEDNAVARVLRQIWFPKVLNRAASLGSDLEFFYGPSWQTVVAETHSKAADKYCARLEQVAQSDPALLTAHAYTRYMGDLSGGQILQRVAIKAMNLSASEGTQYYEFDEIDSPKLFKKAYRARLESLPFPEEVREQIATEAIYSFRLSLELFSELDVIMGETVATPQAAPKGQCPFGYLAKTASETVADKGAWLTPKTRSQSRPQIVFICCILAALLAVALQYFN